MTALRLLAVLNVLEDPDTHPCPDLMLLDINMPRKSGMDVLRHVKGWRRTWSLTRASRACQGETRRRDIGSAPPRGTIGQTATALPSPTSGVARYAPTTASTALLRVLLVDLPRLSVPRNVIPGAQVLLVVSDDVLVVVTLPERSEMTRPLRVTAALKARRMAPTDPAAGGVEV